MASAPNSSASSRIRSFPAWNIDVAVQEQRIASSAFGEARHQIRTPGIEGKDLRFKPVPGEQPLKVPDASAFVARRVRRINPGQVLKDF